MFLLFVAGQFREDDLTDSGSCCREVVAQLTTSFIFRKTAPAPKDDDELPSYDAPPSAGIRMESLQQLQAAPPEGAYTRIPLSMR